MFNYFIKNLHEPEKGMRNFSSVDDIDLMSNLALKKLTTPFHEQRKFFLR